MQHSNERWRRRHGWGRNGWAAAISAIAVVAGMGTAQCAYIDESFSSTELPALWEPYQNGGSLSLTSGTMFLTSQSSTFPYVRTVPGLASSAASPWSFETRIRWPVSSAGGVGVQGTLEAIENQGINCSGGPAALQSIGAWRDTAAASGTLVTVGSSIATLGIGGTEFHVFRWDGVGNTITFSLDGNPIISGSGSPPTDIWFGNPCNFFGASWSSLEVDYAIFIGNCPNVWTDGGCSLQGSGGSPSLSGTGTLAPSSLNSVTLTLAAPNSPAALFLALSSSPIPFKGGTLKPFPFLIPPLILNTDVAGTISIPFMMPTGVPSGTEIWSQLGIQDAGAPNGVALSNALVGITP